jgi:hypothetical protein
VGRVKAPTTAPDGFTPLVELLTAPGGSKNVYSPFLEITKLWDMFGLPVLPQAGSEQVDPDISPEGLIPLRPVPTAPGALTDVYVVPFRMKPWLTLSESKYSPTITPCGLMKLGTVNVEPGGSNDVNTPFAVNVKP